MKSKLFNYGGIAAAVILIAFGIGALAMGVSGRDTVRTGTERIQIAIFEAPFAPVELG